MRKGRFCAVIAALAGASSSFGCVEDIPIDDSEFGVVTTQILVSPSAFLGDVPCSGKQGALQSYVVTLTDHTDPERLITLPSSPPTPCSLDTSFRYITPGHAYTAEIDAYDVPASGLAPLGKTGSGSRHMALKADSQAVAPRFTTSCTDVTAVQSVIARVTECAPLTDHKGAGATSITVDPRLSLGGLQCASEGGTVASFDILPVAPMLPAFLGVACGAAPVMYTQGVEVDQTHTFRLEARAEAGGDVVWGASCFAVAEAGLVTGASCDSLASTGAIEVDMAAVLASGVACGAGMPELFEVGVPALALSSGPVACGKSARFVTIEPGTYEVVVRAFGAAGGAEATCEAKVAPGMTAMTACTTAP